MEQGNQAAKSKKWQKEKAVKQKAIHHVLSPAEDYVNQLRSEDITKELREELKILLGRLFVPRTPYKHLKTKIDQNMSPAEKRKLTKRLREQEQKAYVTANPDLKLMNAKYVVTGLKSVLEATASKQKLKILFVDSAAPSNLLSMLMPTFKANSCKVYGVVAQTNLSKQYLGFKAVVIGVLDNDKEEFRQIFKIASDTLGQR